MLAVVSAFIGVTEAGFVNYDDAPYVLEHPLASASLGISSVRAAFTVVDDANWQPLTWISHQVDGALFGGFAPGRHLTSLLLHALCALLIFAFARRALANDGSALVAALLFGVHPLRVEAVAWISARNEVLAGLFGALTLYAYALYVERRTTLRYACVVVAFVLGLLSKPTLVTLPFVLLLCDVWPLRRVRLFAPKGARGPVLLAIAEKLPLLAFSITVAMITVRAQGETGASPVSVRAANAAVSVVRYLRRVIVPGDLWTPVVEPPLGWPTWVVIAAVLLIAATTVVALRVARRAPQWLVAWLWLLGVLVPMSGLVAARHLAMADRYTYLSCIGIALAVGAAVSPWLARTRIARAVVGTAILSLCVLTARQVGVWRNTETLFLHAIDIDPHNPTAFINLAGFYVAEGRPRAALELFARLPEDEARDGVHGVRGQVLFDLGRARDAVEAYVDALTEDPQNGVLHLRLARALLLDGDVSHAQLEARRALDPPRPARVEDVVRFSSALANSGGDDRSLLRLLLERERNAARVHELRELLCSRGDLESCVR